MWNSWAESSPFLGISCFCPQSKEVMVSACVTETRHNQTEIWGSRPAFQSHGFLRPALISEHISTASQTESNKQNCKEIYFIRASQVAQCIKNLSAMLETWGMCVLSVGHEDPLEEALATHSSTLAWRIPKRAWWTTVHRVAKSQTRLKQLSKHMCFIT